MLIRYFVFTFSFFFALSSWSAKKPSCDLFVKDVLSSLSSAHVESLVPLDLLPSQGRSIFDKLIIGNGGEIPYPLGKLVKLIDENSQGALSMVTIPQGRSLARFGTNIEKPRLVFAPSRLKLFGRKVKAGEKMSAGDLYIGYSETTNSLEVISYNTDLHRYEFQIVKDYTAKGIRKPEYVSRNLCVSCHQNEGPIWSSLRWDEIHSVDYLPKKLKKKYKLSIGELTGFSGWNAHMRGLHEAILEGSHRINANRLLDSLCGINIQCRDQLIKAALITPISNETSPNVIKIISKLPEKNLALEVGNIPNLDPLKQNSLLPLPANLDPMTPREKLFVKKTDPNQTFQISEGFMGNDIFGRGLTHTSINEKEVLVALNSVLPSRLQMEKIFNLPNMARDQIYKKIGKLDFSLALDEKGKIDAQKIWLILSNEFDLPAEKKSFLSKKVNSPTNNDIAGIEFRKISLITGNKTVNHYKKYCQECHVGNADYYLNFMEGKTDAEIINNIKSNQSIADRLNWKKTPEEKQMPPMNSSQAKALKSDIAAQKDMRSVYKK